MIGPILHVDMTPTEDLPLRILRSYRENCNTRWSSASDGEGPVGGWMAQMNADQRRRGEILDRAIALLQQAEAGRR